VIVTFISIHLVIICVVLLWRTYETHPAYPLNTIVTSGEREPREIEGRGANQRVSRVAGEEAELTGATDVIGAQRRPCNGRRTTAALHGCARSARERSEGVSSGTTERGE
jgi:hypothetical protein